MHGGQLRQIAARYKISAERLVDFSANINPAGPPLSVVAAIQRALEVPSTLAKYPDLELVELKQTIAWRIGVQPENVAVANGFVPLLDACLRSLKIERCLLPVPSLASIDARLRTLALSSVPSAFRQNQGFRYEADTMRRRLLNHSCDAILLANPQNPSGVLCKAGRMSRLIEMATQHRITVLLDEAFIDYCPLESLTRRSTEFKQRSLCFVRLQNSLPFRD